MGSLKERLGNWIEVAGKVWGMAMYVAVAGTVGMALLSLWRGLGKVIGDEYQTGGTEIGTSIAEKERMGREGIEEVVDAGGKKRTSMTRRRGTGSMERGELRRGWDGVDDGPDVKDSCVVQ